MWKQMKGMTTHAALACAVSAGLLAPQAHAQTTTMKFWHNQSVQSIRHEAATLFANRVAEKTKGSLKVDIFAGGVMGDFMANLEGLKLGANDFAAEQPSSISNFDRSKRPGALELPYLFESYEQAWEFMDSPTVASLLEHLPQTTGFRFIAMWENGIRHVTNNKRPIHKPADLEGLKLRVITDPVAIEMMKQFRANPVPMGFGELYTAMQHGVIDGQENPVANIFFARFNEVQKFLSLTAHQYSVLVLVIGERSWQKLTPEQRDAVRVAADEAKWFMRKKNAGLEQEFLDQMKAKGLAVNAVDKAPFRASMTNVYKQFEPVFGKDVVQKVLDQAQAARGKHPVKK